MGELMQRVGQPPVIGQILVGVLLGPSVFGALAPAVYGRHCFPATCEQKAMLDAVAQLGILLLLLMTGMETDLSVFRDARRPAVSISLARHRACRSPAALTLGAVLPDSMLPSPAQRADHRAVPRHRAGDLLGEDRGAGGARPGIRAAHRRPGDHRRRDPGRHHRLAHRVGHLRPGAARQRSSLAAVAGSLLGTVVFLTLSFTVGRRLVFQADSLGERQPARARWRTITISW